MLGDLVDCQDSSRQGGTLLKWTGLSSLLRGSVTRDSEFVLSVIVSRRVCVFARVQLLNLKPA